MELFKILGTIAINNSEANKALSETSKHAKDSAKDVEDLGDSGEKSSGKLSKFFSGVGKAAGVAAKGIAVGLGAAATAIGGLATSAIKQYAEYEQLVGGSQLLFGDAFGYVEDKAKNAYKTVQMSTNEYLQQVNGFSTGLKTALGGNEQAAAELAHKIVVAEADIVAATGNSAENVQNAFNGIMKSNFTMLDNLQLGITPTKEGFQEVIDKVNEWNKANGEATNYQIDNLADCQAALVDYVEMQGLAGYAANEAAGTIQGSWGMLKGAWSNLLVGFSDPSADMQSLIDGVFESVTAFAGNLMPRISQVLTGIATAFETLVPMIVGEIPGLIEQILPPLIEGATALVQGLVNVLPSVLNTLMDALPALIEGVMSIVDALIGALPGIIQAIVAALPALIPQLIDAFVGMVMMLVEMLPQIIQPIIDYLPEIIVSIVDALLGNLPVLIQGCVQLIGGLIAALPQIIVALWEAIKGIFGSLGQMIVGWFEPVKNAVSNAWAAMGNVPGLAQLKTMIEQVWGAIKSFITTYITAIKNIVTTYWNAIKNVISTVINSIKNVISTVWNSIKTIISSVMKLIASVLKGDWEGVKSAISSIVNAIKAVISSVWNGIKNIISSVLNGIKSVVSSVWNGIKSIVTSYLNTIKTVVTSIWNGIKGAISSAMKGIKTTVISAFKELPGKLKSMGKDLVTGLWNGVSDKFGWLTSKIKGFANNVTDKLKNFFGIKSPSRVMRDEVGKQLAEGVAVGLEEGADSAVAAAEQMASDTIAATARTLSDTDISKMVSGLGNAVASAMSSAIDATKRTLSDADISGMVDEFGNATAKLIYSVDRAVSDASIDSAISGMTEKTVEAVEKQFDVLSTYNDMTLADEVAFWGKATELFQSGTDERLAIDKKYFAAKDALDADFEKSAENAQKAAEQAEADKLTNAKNTIDTYKVYNDMSLADEVAYWNKVRMLFKEGTDERIAADKEYFAAKDALESESEKAAENARKTAEQAEAVKLTNAKKTLDNYKVYNEMTLADETAYWDSVRIMFKEGTDERIAADKEYFAAKKAMEAEAEKEAENAIKAAEERERKKLQTAKDTLDTYKVYNEISLADEVAYWNEIRTLFQEGTDERIEADKKYFAAKEDLNDKLLAADQKLQDSLNDINKSVADRTNELLNITSSGFGQALSGEEILGNLEHEVFGLEQYDKTMADLEKKIGGTKAFEDIKAGGIGNLNKAYEMAYFMSDADLQKYVDLYSRKYTQAQKLAQEEMADEVITKTAEAYKEYNDTCAELGVEIVGSTQSMQKDVNTAFQSIEGNINNVSNAFTKMKDLFTDFDWSTIAPGVSSLFVSGTVTATSNPAAYSVGATGASGAEQNNWLVSFLQKFLEALKSMKVQLDSGALVGEIVIPMDEALGILTERKDRGR